MPDIRLNVAIDILPDLIFQVVVRDDDIFQNLYNRIKEACASFGGKKIGAWVHLNMYQVPPRASTASTVGALMKEVDPSTWVELPKPIVKISTWFRSPYPDEDYIHILIVHKCLFLLSLQSNLGRFTALIMMPVRSP